jgi:hypothetical protein
MHTYVPLKASHVALDQTTRQGPCAAFTSCGSAGLSTFTDNQYCMQPVACSAIAANFLLNAMEKVYGVQSYLASTA